MAAFQRSKRLSPSMLRRLIRRLEKKTSSEPLTPEQFYEKLLVWHVAMGGTLPERN